MDLSYIRWDISIRIRDILTILSEMLGISMWIANRSEFMDKVLVSMEDDLREEVKTNAIRMKISRSEYIDKALRREKKYRKGLLGLLIACHRPLGVIEQELELNRTLENI